MSHDIELLLAMTEREIKARYKNAFFGFLWIILNPVLQMIVIGTVFSFVFKVALVNYFPFLFTGLLLWNFFSATLTKVTPAIVFELSLIEKAVFSREVIVLAIILSNLFHTIISFVLFALFLLPFHRLDLWRFLLLPLPLLWISCLVAGIGLLTSSLNVRYRDVNFFVQAVLPLWFYATPIIYALSLLPQRLYLFLYLNPMVGIVETTRWIMLKEKLPELPLICVNLFITFLFLVLGILVFRNQSTHFDDWV